MPLEFNNPTLSDNLQASRLTVQDHRVIEIENLRGPSQDVHNFLTYAHATLRINGVVFAVAGTSLHVLRCSPQVEIGDMVLIDSVTMTPTEPGVAWNFEAVPQELTTSTAPYGYVLLRTAGRYRSSVARGTDREALLAVAGATDVAQELIPLADRTQRLTNTAVDGELVGYASRMFRGRQSVVDSQEPISEVTLPVANIVVGGDTQYVATGLVGYPARGEIFIDELHGTAMSVSQLCARRWLEWRINNHVMSGSREWAIVDYELDDDPDSDDDILYNVVITAGPILSREPTTPVEGPTGVTGNPGPAGPASDHDMSPVEAYRACVPGSRFSLYRYVYTGEYGFASAGSFHLIATSNSVAELQWLAVAQLTWEGVDTTASHERMEIRDTEGNQYYYGEQALAAQYYEPTFHEGPLGDNSQPNEPVVITDATIQIGTTVWRVGEARYLPSEGLLQLEAATLVRGLWYEAMACLHRHILAETDLLPNDRYYQCVSWLPAEEDDFTEFDYIEICVVGFVDSPQAAEPVEDSLPYAEHLTAAERIDAARLTQHQNMRSRLIAITREHDAEYRDCSGNLGWVVWHESTRKFACVRRSGMVVQWQDKAAYIMPSRAAAERLIHREGRGIAVRVPRPLITYSATFNKVQVLDGPDVYRHNTAAMSAVLVGYTQSTAYWQARYLSQDLWLHAVETYHAEEQTALIQGCREHILFSLRAHPTIYRIIPTEYTASEVYWSDNPFRLEINREMRRHQRQCVEYVPRQPTSHRRQLDLS